MIINPFIFNSYKQFNNILPFLNDITQKSHEIRGLISNPDLIGGGDLTESYVQLLSNPTDTKLTEYYPNEGYLFSILSISAFKASV